MEQLLRVFTTQPHHASRAWTSSDVVSFTRKHTRFGLYGDGKLKTLITKTLFTLLSDSKEVFDDIFENKTSRSQTIDYLKLSVRIRVEAYFFRTLFKLFYSDFYYFLRLKCYISTIFSSICLVDGVPLLVVCDF